MAIGKVPALAELKRKVKRDAAHHLFVCRDAKTTDKLLKAAKDFKKTLTQFITMVEYTTETEPMIEGGGMFFAENSRDDEEDGQQAE